MSHKKNYKKKATQPATKKTQVEMVDEQAVTAEAPAAEAKKASAVKAPVEHAEVKTDWKPIIKDFCILLVIMGILGYACNLLKDAFASKSETDSLVSLIRKGDLKEEDGEEVDKPFIKELEEGIENNSDFVNTTDANGRTPLMWAAYTNFNDPTKAAETDINRIYYIDALLEHKADVHKTDEDGFNALHWAAWSGMRFTSYKLVKQGLNINKAEDNGYTPLMLAAMRGNDTVVDLLLKMGADPALKNKDGKTAAELAESSSSAYAKRDSFAYSPVFSKARATSYEKTCDILAKAKPLSDEERCKLEISLEIEMLAAQAEARSARKIALLANKAEEIAKMSLVPMLTLNEKDIDLHHRVKSEIAAIKQIEAAVEGGVEKSALFKTDAEGNSALHIAAKSCKPLCSYQLVAAGLDVTAANKDGKSPLTLAAEQDDILTVQVLLSVDNKQLKKAAEDTIKALADKPTTPNREVIISLLQQCSPLSKKLEDLEFDARMIAASTQNDHAKSLAEASARANAVADVKSRYNNYKSALEQAELAGKAKTEAEAKAAASDKAKSEAEAKAAESDKAKAAAEAKAQEAESARDQAEYNTSVALQAKDEAVAQAAADVASIQSKATMEVQHAKSLVAAADKAKMDAESKASAALKAKDEALAAATAAELSVRNADAAAALAEEKAAAAAKSAEEAEQAKINAETALKAALAEKEEALKAAARAEAALEAELKKQSQLPVETPAEQPAAL